MEWTRFFHLLGCAFISGIVIVVGTFAPLYPRASGNKLVFVVWIFKKNCGKVRVTRMALGGGDAKIWQSFLENNSNQVVITVFLICRSRRWRCEDLVEKMANARSEYAQLSLHFVDPRNLQIANCFRLKFDVLLCSHTWHCCYVAGGRPCRWSCCSRSLFWFQFSFVVRSPNGSILSRCWILLSHSGFLTSKMCLFYRP